MTKLTKNDRIKLKILEQYKRKNISYTPSLLASILEFKYETIKKALEFFHLMGILDKEIKEHGKQNYTYYNLTEIGNIIIKAEKIDFNF
ncbi:MAG: hypothetical protein ACTSR8_19890 [Promethearchaeota archaeon]